MEQLLGPRFTGLLQFTAGSLPDKPANRRCLRMMINRPHLIAADGIGVAAVVIQIASIVILLNLIRGAVTLQDSIAKGICPVLF